MLGGDPIPVLVGIASIATGVALDKTPPWLRGISVGVGAWLLIVYSHQEKTRKHLQSCGMVYGIDWEWADPRDYGASVFLSLPQARDLKTGTIIEIPGIIL